ncbi:MAG TPA: ABC transporter permease [Chloroflexia bacterium]|nr:ABC transporter permease [Chloroflexia bacterium]
MRTETRPDTGITAPAPARHNRIGTTPGRAPSGPQNGRFSDGDYVDDTAASTPQRVDPLRVSSKLAGALLSMAVLVATWWAIVLFSGYPAFILPSPAQVAVRFWSMLADGSLPGHAWTTVTEAALGFLLAFFLGIGLGYPIARSPRLERLFGPYIALTQALPVVALAPLLVIWFKDDLPRNVLIVALICFFPILVNTIVGVRGIDRSLLEMARISGANLLQTIHYVELPLGLRSLLGGLKLGVTLSITGAVVGELVSATSGLGFLLVLGKGLFDTTLVFVGLISLAVLAMAAYAFISLLERVIITWE